LVDDEYYEVCGWDQEGIPKEETFEKYGLISEWNTFDKRLKRRELPVVKALKIDLEKCVGCALAGWPT